MTLTPKELEIKERCDAWRNAGLLSEQLVDKDIPYLLSTISTLREETAELRGALLALAGRGCAYETIKNHGTCFADSDPQEYCPACFARYSLIKTGSSTNQDGVSPGAKQL